MNTAGASTNRHGGFKDVHQLDGLSNKPLGSQGLDSHDLRREAALNNDLPNTGEIGEQKQ